MAADILVRVDPRRWRRLGMGVCALGALASVIVLASSRTETLQAPVGTCDVFLAGAPAGEATRPDRAIPVSSRGTLVASGRDAAATSRAEVRATLAEGWPDRATWSVRRRAFDPPREDFEVAVRMPDVTSYGVGLTLVTVATDNCTASAWIEVGDRPPVFTLLGLVGFALTASGTIALVVNLWRSAAGGGATFPGALGSGLPTGAGVGVLAQQAGTTPLAPSTLAAWIVLGSAAAGGLHLVRRSVSHWRRARRTAGT